MQMSPQLRVRPEAGVGRPTTQDSSPQSAQSGQAGRTPPVYEFLHQASGVYHPSLDNYNFHSKK